MCYYCDASFSSVCTRSAHHINIHGPTHQHATNAPKRFQCSRCNKSYNNSGSLRNHRMFKHSQGRQCDRVNDRFGDRANDVGGDSADDRIHDRFDGSTITEDLSCYSSYGNSGESNEGELGRGTP